jgi:hypothetical protein
MGLFPVCLPVKEHSGMPENCKFMLDYEYQEKKEVNLLADMYDSPRNL